jgi:hypothetical protein
MLRRTMMVVWLSLALLFPALLLAGSNSTKHRWLEGEILSRKTVPNGRGGLQYHYVYRIRGGDMHYVVVAKEPLKLGLTGPVKFVPMRGHVLLQDSDGRECKLSMLERHKRAYRRWK